jgi:hypothetical protein
MTDFVTNKLVVDIAVYQQQQWVAHPPVSGNNTSYTVPVVVKMYVA